MAVPASRDEFREYCLRRLGYPVLQINLADEQIDDCIDSAISMFQKFHFDGTERIYFKRKLTASSLTFSPATTGTFIPGETVTGGTSAKTAVVVDQASNNLSIRVKEVSGTFTNSETITGNLSGATATLASSNALTLGDVDNKYLTMPDDVLSVLRVLDFGILSGHGIFDARYQMALNSISEMGWMDMVSYTLARQYYALVDQLISGQVGLRFNAKQGRVYLDFDWASEAIVDNYVVIEAYSSINPETWSKVWSDSWLQDYATALIKRDWGSVLKKYRGIKLTGGVELDGGALYAEAVSEIEKLEASLEKKYQEPVDFFVG